MLLTLLHDGYLPTIKSDNSSADSNDCLLLVGSLPSPWKEELLIFESALSLKGPSIWSLLIVINKEDSVVVAYSLEALV